MPSTYDLTTPQSTRDSSGANTLSHSPFAASPPRNASLRNMAASISAPYQAAQLALKSQERNLAAAEKKLAAGQEAFSRHDFSRHDTISQVTAALACYESGLRYVDPLSTESDGITPREAACYNSARAKLTKARTDAQQALTRMLKKERDRKLEVQTLRDLVDGHMSEARQLMERHRFAAAEGQLELALELEIEDASLAESLGRLYAEVRDKKKKQERQQAEAEECYIKGEKAMLEKQYRQADAHYRKALEFEIGDDELKEQYRQAQAEAAKQLQQRLSTAARALSDTVSGTKNDIWNAFAEGQQLALQGEFAGAISQYNRAIGKLGGHRPNGLGSRRGEVVRSLRQQLPDCNSDLGHDDEDGEGDVGGVSPNLAGERDLGLSPQGLERRHRSRSARHHPRSSSSDDSDSDSNSDSDMEYSRSSRGRRSGRDTEFVNHTASRLTQPLEDIGASVRQAMSQRQRRHSSRRRRRRAPARHHGELDDDDIVFAAALMCVVLGVAGLARSIAQAR